VSSALLCVHFVGKHIVGHGACDGHVEPCQQLLERLAFPAAEHGDALPAFAGHGDTASWLHDSDNDLAVVDEVFDVGQSREVEGGFAVFWKIYAACFGSRSSFAARRSMAAVPRCG
jgi:hypothetical protein